MGSVSCIKFTFHRTTLQTNFFFSFFRSAHEALTYQTFSPFCVVLYLVTQLCPTLWEPMDCSPATASVHGIFQARTLGWVAMPSCRESSQPRDQTQVSSIAGRLFTVWSSGKPFQLSNLLQMPNSYRMVNLEFSGNFSCSYKRISFSDALSWSLSTSDAWSLCFSFSRLLSLLQNFLNHHCTVRS